jgi:murein DD-endopeptidase MepM/ murein hydrolase activator NlpD
MNLALRLALLCAAALSLPALALPVPGIPKAVIAIAGNTTAEIKWAQDPDAERYIVLRSSVSGGPYTVVHEDESGLQWTDSNLTNGLRYFYVVRSTNVTGTSANSVQARVTPNSAAAPGSVLWPLAATANPDADGIRYQYGPRRLSNYDFHAGVDIPAPSGTPIHAVMDGTVTAVIPDDGDVGSGNYVLINHGEQKWVAYLHMNAFKSGLTVGTTVQAGDLIGYVGTTGANSNHLHMTYMVGLVSEAVSEMRSKNPMEILPHTIPDTPTVAFANDATNKVRITLPAHRMRARWLILKGGGQTRMVDFYQIVTQGSSPRNERSQSGIYIDASTPPKADPVSRQNFILSARPEPVTDFVPDQVILLDFEGNVIVDAPRP